MRMIFVNLPVKELTRSQDFYKALGFELNPEFSDDDAGCIVISESIYVMLLTEPRFRDFIVGDIADATSSTEVLNCLSAESREEVDSLFSKALESGGSEWKPTMEQGPMYSRSFQDPDGHVWEVLHMEMTG